MKGSKMKIRCLKCNDIIESKHVHDLKNVNFQLKEQKINENRDNN